MKNLKVYCIVPGFADSSKQVAGTYLESVIQLSKLAERSGFDGALIHYNHHVINPWMIASAVVQHTERFLPLIALQPVSMPPYTAAKMIEGIQQLYGRTVDINMITGAVNNELLQIGDTIHHDERYERLIEYIDVVKLLLTSNGEEVSYKGKFYSIDNVALSPGMREDSMPPTFFVAGSSEAGVKAAVSSADVMVTHPGPIDEFVLKVKDRVASHRINLGIRVGIIARVSRKEAWEVAYAMFPYSRQGDIKLKLKKNSDSNWIRELAQLADSREVIDEVFWMGAYRTGKSYCAYLVGDYDTVARYLYQYLKAGVKYLLIDGPYDDEEFEHVSRVLAATEEHYETYVE